MDLQKQGGHGERPGEQCTIGNSMESELFCSAFEPSETEKQWSSKWESMATEVENENGQMTDSEHGQEMEQESQPASDTSSEMKLEDYVQLEDIPIEAQEQESPLSPGLIQQIEKMQMNSKPPIHKPPNVHRGSQRILDTPKLFDYSEDQQKRQDKEIMAITLINRGYGSQYFKDELLVSGHGSADEGRYKSAAGSMARETFRRLQKFMKEECRIKLPTLNSYEIKLLQTLLLNCRTTLSKGAVKKLFELIKVTYKIDPTAALLEREAIDLYNEIGQALTSKIKCLKPLQTPPIYAIQLPFGMPPKKQYLPKSRQNTTQPMGAPSSDRDYLREYVTEVSFSKIRQTLRASHKIDEFVSTGDIKNSIRRQLRTYFRRLETSINTNPYEGGRSYQKMPEQKIKWFLDSSEASSLRYEVCRMQLKDWYPKENCETIFRTIWKKAEEKIAKMQALRNSDFLLDIS